MIFSVMSPRILVPRILALTLALLCAAMPAFADKKQSQLERDTELEPGDMLLVTRNKMEHLSRFTKASNLGVYFNPFPAIP